MDKSQFTVLGGGQEVGRSSFLLDFGGKILLERGVKLTPDKTEYPLPVSTNLDAVVISHAHLDHSGVLPHLFKDSSFISYLTQPTLDLAKMLWFDSLKIAGMEGMEPEFSKDEIEKTEQYSFAVAYRRRLDITKECTLEFFDAGHIIGSALAKLSFRGRTMLYTGDFKVEDTRLLKGADLDAGKIDTLVMESTYGDRNHPPRKETEKLFIEEVRETIESGGWAIVPAFAVGRSQEMVDILYEHKIGVPVYFDGMCQKAARISLGFPQYLKNARGLKRALESAIWVKNESWRKRALKQPCVIVTTSGMLQGGPSRYYIKKLCRDENSAVLLTGYQVEKTPGRMLMETKRAVIDGEEIMFRGKVEKFDFSAHASQQEMMKAVEKWSPEKIILVHGDKEVALSFGAKIKAETGIETVVPRQGESVQL